VKKNWNSGTYKQLELKGVIAYLLYNGCASFMGMQAEEQLRILLKEKDELFDA